MAIGARILSNNLSGLTADVTFLPLTGGSINVGAKTVPFNYIDTYPYGLYNLYFSGYDYTYTVIVENPTPLQVSIQSNYSIGSLVADYVVTLNPPTSKPFTLSFTNTLGQFNGSDIVITTGATFAYGDTKKHIQVTLSDKNYNNLNGVVLFSGITGAPSGATVTPTLPIGLSQSLMFTSTLRASDNYGSAFLDYTNVSATTIDLGVDSAYYNLWDVQPFQGQGYVYVFMYANGQYNRIRFVVVNSVGAILDDYEITTNSNQWNYDICGGKLFYIVDKTNGVLRYYDDVTGYTYNWNSTTFPNSQIYWDYDNCTSDGTIVLELHDNTNYQLYLMNKNNQTLFDSYSINDKYRYVELYYRGNFIVTIDWFAGYTSLKNISFWGSDGSLKHSFDLPEGTYNQINYNFYGSNKFYLFAYNYTTLNVSWNVFVYDGNTNTYTNNTYDRNLYPSKSVTRTSGLYPHEFNSENIYIFLINYGGNFNYGMDYVNNCLILYTGGSSTLNEYLFQNDGSPTKAIQSYGDPDEVLSINCWTGGSNLSVLTLKDNSQVITDVDPLSLIIDRWYYQTGDKFILILWIVDHSHPKIYVFDKNGQITDTLILTLNGDYQLRIDVAPYMFYVTDYSDGYYISKNSSTFQLTNAYNGSVTTNGYYSPNFLRESNILLYSQNSPYVARTLSPSGLSGEFTFPDNTGRYELQIGKDKILYTYCDINTGIVIINLYDFNFNLLTSYNTGYYNFWYTTAIKDRYRVLISVNSLYLPYMVTESGVILIDTLTNNNSYNTPNDWVNWND